MMSLRVDWCTYDAAAYACRTWHYSRAVPMPPMQHLGVWEGGRFIGAIVFAKGASPTLGCPFGATRAETAELVRVALRQHESPVSRMMRFAIKLLRVASPGLRLLVSYADPEQGHHGGIYQASGWVYTGASGSAVVYDMPDGTMKHGRDFRGASFGRQIAIPKGAVPRRTEPKHRYALGLDPAMRDVVRSMEQPRPRCAPSIDDDAPGSQPGEAGSLPSGAL